MRPPGFWQQREPSLTASLLSPLERITASATARRLRRPGWMAPVPVICCGNVGVGGAGKTTLALDLAAGLGARGLTVHCITRGYGGRHRQSVTRVEPDRHDAAEVGDEALLLAQVAPCWVAADRAAAAREAVAAGAQILLMDDGLQNPGLLQDWPLLVVDGAVGFGNGRLLPAGPLREPVACAAARAAASVLIGPDRAGATAMLPASLPLFRADLAMDPVVAAWRGTRLLAFAGIGRPAKFFTALEADGLTLAGAQGFPDHHRFRTRELDRLQRKAAWLQARLVTTPKDAVRLPAAWRAQVLIAGVSLRWADPTARAALLGRLTEMRR